MLVLRGPPAVVSAAIVLVRKHRPRRTLLKAIAFRRIRRGTLEIGRLAPVAVTRVLVGARRTGRWARGLILDSISWRRRLQFRHRVTDVPAIRDTPGTTSKNASVRLVPFPDRDESAILAWRRGPLDFAEPGSRWSKNPPIRLPRSPTGPDLSLDALKSSPLSRRSLGAAAAILRGLRRLADYPSVPIGASTVVFQKLLQPGTFHDRRDITLAPRGYLTSSTRHERACHPSKKREAVPAFPESPGPLVA